MDRPCLHIDGEWVPPLDGRFVAVVEAAAGKEMARAALGGPRDVAAAVAAAGWARTGWAATPAAERAEVLDRLAVWTADEGRGLALAGRIETGTVGVNHYALDVNAPFGGVKASGLGRELGPEGIQPYLVTRSLYLPPVGAR
jgi:acyl-CoA reductase-like NAD-dependent aldehyde dehydrogenase